MQAIAGRTWSGIEFGEAPLYAYSFFQVRRVRRRGVPGDTTLNRHNPWLLTPPQYADAVRVGDLALFKRIEEETSDWWFPTLDRGAGAALHFAVDHGQARPKHCLACLAASDTSACFCIATRSWRW